MLTDQWMQQILQTETPYGTAAVWWAGQMGLWLKMGATVLCIDYYARPDPRRQTAPPIPAEAVRNVDVFMGSHNHLDHIDHESWQIWGRNCPGSVFVYPRLHTASLLEDCLESQRLLGMNDGETICVKDVRIHALAAAHEFLSRDPETGLYPCLQYIIEGNGLRVYHAGDTLRYEGMLAKLQAAGRMDLAILPINGRDGVRYRRNCIGNMTYQEAADLAGELEPGAVIPGHWDMFADNPGDPDAFEDYLDAKYPGKICCLRPGIMETVMLQKQTV